MYVLWHVPMTLVHVSKLELNEGEVTRKTAVNEVIDWFPKTWRAQEIEEKTFMVSV